MFQILVRFLVGGAVVSLFAVIGDVLKPKSLAGLFGAAPSVALATLGLTIAADGAGFAAIEGRSMIIGAVALFAYASFVSWAMVRYKPKALMMTTGAILLWLAVALAGWHLFVN